MPTKRTEQQNCFLRARSLHKTLAKGWKSCALPIFLIGILGTIFWLWMLIDCLSKEPSGNEKILWAVVILFTHLLGALLYYFIRRPQRMRGG